MSDAVVVALIGLGGSGLGFLAAVLSLLISIATGFPKVDEK